MLSTYIYDYHMIHIRFSRRTFSRTEILKVNGTDCHISIYLRMKRVISLYKTAYELMFDLSQVSCLFEKTGVRVRR